MTPIRGKQLSDRAVKHDVMGKEVNRPVVTQLVIEVDSEHRPIYLKKAARVIRHHQRPAERQPPQATHFRPEVPLNTAIPIPKPVPA